jgi:hypothetical protein
MTRSTGKKFLRRQMSQILRSSVFVLLVFCAGAQTANDQSHQSWFGGTNRPKSPATTGSLAALTPMQPLAQQIRRLEAALELLGQPLNQDTRQAIDQAISTVDEEAGVALLQQALDPDVLAIVTINPESRVKVERGPAQAELVQGGSRFFLVKVMNLAGVTSRVSVTSPNNGNVFITSNGDSAPAMLLTQADVRDRWAQISISNSPPLDPALSGFPVEYQILEVYSRDAGQRSASMAFGVGQGTQDLGFRNELSVLFSAKPSHPIKLRISDEHGKPTIASLTIRDSHSRLYPNPSKRLAPDLYFQPQVYRADGESIDLPPGNYTVIASGGPEYLTHSREFQVTPNSPHELELQLTRWIDPSKSGWYSGDTHVHAAGCAHYKNPAEGVLPQDMMRQIAGEKLNVGSVLTWGPDYYYQKQFFSSHDDPLSTACSRMHYDLEVSGFPSSHAGHLVLLGLKDQDYPGTRKIEDWPTWDLPILQWAHAQGAVIGFAHSGWGLQVADDQIPSYQMPGFDGIGANEYIVDVTQPNAVDFLSIGDTPIVWELSSWYHTLNLGFRTRIAGETDFPCITDARVGLARSYVQLKGPLTYAAWLDGLKTGRSYVSDGRTHLMGFSVDGTAVGTNDSEVALARPGAIHVAVHAAALLDAVPDPAMKTRPYDQKPYWSIERARIGDSREVAVELVVNGSAVLRKPILADGSLQDVSFDFPLERSSWIAVRVLGAAHTNPIFVTVGGKPIRASKMSAEWAMTAVHQCWSQKSPRIAASEFDSARSVYDHAEAEYKRLASECLAK